MRRALALALLVTLPALALPGAAAGTTTLDEATAPGVGWVAWRVQSDGQPIVATVIGTDFSGRIGGGFLVFGPSGRLLFAEASVEDLTRYGAHYEARVPGVATVGQTIWPSATGSGEITRTLTLTASPGAWTILAHLSGDAASWTHRLETNAGATLLAKTSGASSFLLDMRAADGDAEARARAYNLGARVDAGATLDRSVANGFFATTVSVGADQATVAGPGGPVGCQRPGAWLLTAPTTPCTFLRATGGTYTAALTGAGVATRQHAEFFLVGADAQLPSA